MNKDKKDTTFHFGVVEENGRGVLIEVTEEDYQQQIAAGVPEDEILPVGIHKARRGGFRERHPNFSSENVEIRITNDKKENSFSVKNDKDKKAA